MAFSSTSDFCIYFLISDSKRKNATNKVKEKRYIYTYQYSYQYS